MTAGTIFNDSHLPLTIWFTAVLLLCEAKKGMSALQLKRTIWGQHKGSYKTAWYLCHRIRAAMKEAERPMLDGTVEMDETYVGGKQRNLEKHWRKDRKGRLSSEFGSAAETFAFSTLRMRSRDVAKIH